MQECNASYYGGVTCLSNIGPFNLLELDLDEDAKQILETYSFNPASLTLASSTSGRPGSASFKAENKVGIRGIRLQSQSQLGIFFC
jgi:hypothetical protein